MPLFKQKAEELLQELNSSDASGSGVKGWELSPDAKSISKGFTFKNFAEALAFANQIGGVAEKEGHHPDLTISWGKVGVQLSTHVIGGLSENDFILAAKIDTVEV